MYLKVKLRTLNKELETTLSEPSHPAGWLISISGKPQLERPDNNDLINACTGIFDLQGAWPSYLWINYPQPGKLRPEIKGGWCFAITNCSGIRSGTRAEAWIWAPSWPRLHSQDLLDPVAGRGLAAGQPYRLPQLKMGH